MHRKTREDVFIEKLSELLRANRAADHTTGSHSEPAVSGLNRSQAGQRGSGTLLDAPRRQRSDSGTAERSQTAQAADNKPMA